MSEKKTACGFKTSVGGQALMEGIMMRGPFKTSVAVRRPDGGIEVKVTDNKPSRWNRIPVVRGVITFVRSLVDGYNYLMYSAEVSMGDDYIDEESKFDRWVEKHFGEKGTKAVTGAAAVLGGGLAILLFLVLPTFLVGLISRFADLGGWKAFLESVIKIVIFLGYMAAVSLMKEIYRVFCYHGAEHKTISCYEAGEELTVENIRRHTRFHPRCGTSFLLIVVVISILVGSVLPWTSTLGRVGLKLLTLPVVMGVSYEILKAVGRHDNWFTRIIRAPGLWLQRLTTHEPDDSMLEVAIAAVTPVLPENREDGAF